MDDGTCGWRVMHANRDLPTERPRRTSPSWLLRVASRTGSLSSRTTAVSQNCGRAGPKSMMARPRKPKKSKGYSMKRLALIVIPAWLFLASHAQAADCEAQATSAAEAAGVSDHHDYYEDR